MPSAAMSLGSADDESDEVDEQELLRRGRSTVSVSLECERAVSREGEGSAPLAVAIVLVVACSGQGCEEGGQRRELRLAFSAMKHAPLRS